MDELAEVVRVTYIPDDDHLGEVVVRARFDGFEGQAKSWVSRERALEFAQALQQYPLADDMPVVLSAGLGVDDDYQEFVGISAVPVGDMGQVVLTISLVSDGWRAGAPVVHRATIEFPTSYEPLRRFSDQLKLVLDGKLDQAVLDSDELA